jgi:hypothetical protein
VEIPTKTETGTRTRLLIVPKLSSAGKTNALEIVDVAVTGSGGVGPESPLGSFISAPDTIRGREVIADDA